MRVDRVKLVAEMTRREIRTEELASRACVSRATVSAMRGGKSCNENSIRRVANALDIPVESLLEGVGGEKIS